MRAISRSSNSCIDSLLQNRDQFLSDSHRQQLQFKNRFETTTENRTKVSSDNRRHMYNFSRLMLAKQKVSGAPKRQRVHSPLYDLEDPRLGDLIKPGADGDVVLIGFPYDIGVQRNGGMCVCQM
jgi:hypothetical protein